MRKGKLTGGVAFLLVLAFFGTVAVRRDGLLEHWYLYRLHATDVDDRHKAIRELGDRRSVRAIEPLSTMIADFSDEELHVDILVALAKIGTRAHDTIVGVIEQLSRLRAKYERTGDNTFAERLQLAFDTLASQGNESVPILLHLVSVSYDAGNLNLARDAAAALEERGKDVLERLTDALDGGDTDRQIEAAFAIGWTPLVHDELVAPLAAQATSSDAANVRAATSYALMRIMPALKRPDSVLLRLLEDDDPGVRKYALHALPTLGGGVGVIPRILERLNDPDASVRLASVVVLGELGTAAAGAVPRLIEMAESTTGDLRHAVLNSLGQIGPPAIAAVPILCRVVEDEDNQTTRETAIRALGSIGPEASRSVPILEGLRQQHDDRVLRRAARSALTAITGKYEEY